MIESRELVKVYPGDIRALDGVSFKVERGEVCGYIGANGAGKSTTIKILSGMLQLTSGSAFVNGYNVAEEPQKVKKSIGYVPESGAMFESLTPYDFLEFVCKIFEIEKSVYKTRIFSFMELFDLRPEIHTPMASFSKGMKQKVLLISSLIHNPDVIFWDEPLGGIDFNTTVMLRDLVKDLSSSGRTFFYSTHILDAVEKICSKVIILNHGRIVHDMKLDGDGNKLSLEEIFRKYIDAEEVKSKVAGIFKNLSK